MGHYFPMEAGSLTFGPFTIDMVTADESNQSYTIRDFTITSSKRVSFGCSAFFKSLFRTVSLKVHVKQFTAEI